MAPEWLVERLQKARGGDPEAIAFTAAAAALGAGEPQSWSLALQRLVQAAELGSASARGQLRVLADAEPEARDWRALGAAVDWQAWLSPAPKGRLLSEPRISASPDFLSGPACAWLIGRAEGRIQQARVFDPVTGQSRVEPERDNSAFEIGFADVDLVVLAVRARIAATVGMPTGALETPQVLHYAPGQKFDRHYDFLDLDVPGYAADVARRGQRVATFLIYLNEGYAAGETDFPMVGLTHKGATGDALMFSNVDAAGRADRRTLHAGLPPTAGEKWLFSQWIRDRVST
ncbi:MAG: 2OG-Fe(II) oxygenase [Phenylobacterium sp.]